MKKYKNLIRTLTLIFLASCFVFQKSFAQEFIILDSIITATEKEKGFCYFFPDTTTTGIDWMSPFDYYNGNFEIRYEILDYKADKEMRLSVCIWSEVKERWTVFKENCSPQTLITGKGVFTTTTTPGSWWKKDNVPVNFSRIDLFLRMGLVIWCADRKNISPWVPDEESCWDSHDEYLPFKLRLSIVAVADGHEFSGWNNY